MEEIQRYCAKIRPLRCPKCDSAKVVEILYGMPTQEVFEVADRGLVALGGCCVTGYEPSWQCLECNNMIYRERLRRFMQDAPYSLGDKSIIEHRLSLLDADHVAPLTVFVNRMKKPKRAKVPYFDPFDGGQYAEILFLLEAPGPCAIESGFISRNNPDPTAKNFFELNMSVGLDRKKTIMWNIVPWHIRNENNNIRPASEDDIKQGQEILLELLSLLKNLKIIVLVGKKSQSIHVWLSAETNAHIYALHHPSNRVKNSYPGKFDENKNVLQKIARECEE